MNLEEFAARVRRHVETRLGKGYYVELKKMRKNNGVTLTGLVIRKYRQDVAPAIYLEPYWESYEEGSTMKSVVDRILELYRNGMPELCLNTDFFYDFEQVRERIIFRLVNREKNRELLEEIPYIPYLDLAICFSYSFYEKVLGIGSILVYNKHVAAWGTEKETLYRLALENMPRLFPPQCVAMEEILAQYSGEAPEVRTQDAPPCGVLTNCQRIYGASVVLYPGFLEEVAGGSESGYFLLPSSVHEFLIVPRETADVSVFRRMVGEVNRTLSPEEFLSESVYSYDAAGGLRVADM